MSAWSKEAELAAHAAREQERSQANITGLADIAFRLASIDRELGDIQSSIRHQSTHTIIMCAVVSCVVSTIVSGLTAALVGKILIAPAVVPPLLP